jgi:hypothetical protein
MIDPLESTLFGFSKLDETPIFPLESADLYQTPLLHQNACFGGMFGAAKADLAAR